MSVDLSFLEPPPEILPNVEQDRRESELVYAAKVNAEEVIARNLAPDPPPDPVIKREQLRQRMIAIVNRFPLRPTNPEMIVILACEICEITPKQLFTNKRHEVYGRARAIVARVLRDRRWPYPKIAAVLHMHQHSSTIAARRRGETRYINDVKLVRSVLLECAKRRETNHG